MQISALRPVHNQPPVRTVSKARQPAQPSYPRFGKTPRTLRAKGAAQPGTRLSRVDLERRSAFVDRMRGVRDRLFRALTLKARPADTRTDKHIEAFFKSFRIRNVETANELASRVATPAPTQSQRTRFSARA